MKKVVFTLILLAFQFSDITHLIIYAQNNTLSVRGLYVQFERRGWSSGYWSGDAIQSLNNFDGVVGHTVAEEISIQLDSIKKIGINTIAFELRTSDSIGSSFVFPTCYIHPVLGFRWPQPLPQEISNLKQFFDIVQSKGFRVFLRLVNNHMEENPTTNSSIWLGAILGAIKDHPALDLVLFEGNTHAIDTNGDGIPDECGTPAEPPLWLGAKSVPAIYVSWAITFAKNLGIPYKKLSAEAVVGDFFTMSNPPSGSDATDSHLWSPIVVLKKIFDTLSIPNDQRTYALSIYEHRKCQNNNGLPCVDKNPHDWARETLDHIFATIGKGNGARVVAPEMGLSSASDTSWRVTQAMQSLIDLFKEYNIDGGCFWRWTNFDNSEDSNPSIPDAIKRRGTSFTYTSVKNILAANYITAVQLHPNINVDQFVLSQNFPNPFNPTTKIQFELREKANVKLYIYNGLGQCVTQLISQELNPGNYTTDWDASRFASGVYFCHLEIHPSGIEKFHFTKKLVLVK